MTSHSTSAAKPAPTLRRALGLWLLTFYGLGTIIGARIYVLIGEVADTAGFAAPLAFLANKLAELDGLGGHLKAGDIVITGAPIRSVEVKAGSRLHADFGSLGTIDLDFI